MDSNPRWYHRDRSQSDAGSAKNEERAADIPAREGSGSVPPDCRWSPVATSFAEEIDIEVEQAAECETAGRASTEGAGAGIEPYAMHRRSSSFKPPAALLESAQRVSESSGSKAKLRDADMPVKVTHGFEPKLRPKKSCESVEHPVTGSFKEAGSRPEKLAP